MQKRAYDLMKLWCDTLLTYRVSSPHTLLDGALLCPVCHVIHGRIADLAYPLTLLYARSGDKRYLDAADQLIDWTDKNLSRPDGSWRNDAGNEWKGISAFSAIAIGEAIHRHKDCLPESIYTKWRTLFVRISDYLCDTFLKTCTPNINYYAGVACEQALAWTLTGDERYRTFAREQEAFCRAHFDEDGLFYGEMRPLEFVTPKGLRPIDMGYNIEESLPLLVRCTQLLGENQAFYRERFRDHLKFMLPDGAIDNSWGSRHNKWTWWGSRTSDGALEGLALLADEPLFAEACERVLALYETCTHDGLLALPMAPQAGEPTCLHHAFCHAKALAVLAEADFITPERTSLPTEVCDGIHFFQKGNLALVNHAGWRATISASDLLYAPGCENGGGSMTLLLKDGHPLCAATMRQYNPVEPLNMQMLRQCDQTPCMTPRLCFSGDTDNLQDTHVSLEKNGDYSVTAQGDGWSIRYDFEDNLRLSIRTDRPSTFLLPIICDSAPVCQDGGLRLGSVLVCAPGLRHNPSASGFNQVGGFIWQTLELPVDQVASIVINTVL